MIKNYRFFKLLFLAITTLLSLVLTRAADPQSFAIFQVGSGIGWHTLKIGGGGQVTGISLSNDGLTMVARIDVFGAYVSYNGANWQQLITSVAIPSSIYNATNWALTTSNGANSGRDGAYEVIVAPSNNSRIYMIWYGWLLRSNDRGNSFTKCSGWSQIDLPTSSGNVQTYKLNGPKMAVDPANPDVVYVGTPKAGLYVTTDGCATMTSLSPSTVPTAGTDGSSNYPGYTITFDAGSGTTGGKTNTIYAHAYGSGVYVSTNAGSTFAAIASTPTTNGNLTVCGGTLWIVSGQGDQSGSNTNVYKYSSGTVTRLTTTTLQASNAAEYFACDPNNSNHLVYADQGAIINWSSDGGATWSAPYFQQSPGANIVPGATATDVPWLQKQWQGQTPFWTLGSLHFDQSVANRIWMGSGIGAWHADGISTSLGANINICGGNSQPACRVNWTSFTAGIENQVGVGACSSPNGAGTVTLQTEQMLFNVNPSASIYPTDTVPSQARTIANLGTSWNGLLSGFSCDYVNGTPNTIVGLLNGPNVSNNDTSGISTDGGATMTVFTTNPTDPQKGSSIAAGSSTNFIIVTGDSGGARYTKDGGSTWANLSITPTTGDRFILPKTICSDKSSGVSNKFYIENGTSLQVSTNSGDSWSTNSTLPGSSNSGWVLTTLLCVPQLGSVATAGHLILNPGNSYQVAGHSMYFSKDGGATWSAFANVTDVLAVSTGAPKPGGNGYPTIWIAGLVNGVYGIWRCDDYNSANNTGCNGGNWISEGTWPNNSLDCVNGIEGDKNMFGRVYVAFCGNGLAWGQFNYLLKRDLRPANDNSPAWLNAVA